MSIQLASMLCRFCRSRRWNDGTKCVECGTCENKHIQLIDGAYVDIRFTPYVPVPRSPFLRDKERTLTAGGK